MNKLLVLAVLLISLPSFASRVVGSLLSPGDRIRFVDAEGTTGGGEFGVYKKNSASPAGGDAQSAELFRTFCVEKNEYMDFNTKGFVIDSITQSAVAGGVGGGSPDPISDKTAWLFYNFTMHTLAGYDYTPNSAAHVTAANNLQKAIWFLENEITLTQSQQNANPFLVAANAATLAARQFAATRVYVLNIKWATDRNGFDGVYENLGNGQWSAPGPGDNAQSMLYVIPEPGSAAIWVMLGGGVVGAVVARRRMGKNTRGVV